jgi:DNA-binding Lrp family transcriptional regulator
MKPAMLDELEKEILIQLGTEGRKMITEIEESVPAARQTVHVRVERLVLLGHVREERKARLPFRRYLSLTAGGKHALELELSKERVTLEQRERAVAAMLQP